MSNGPIAQVSLIPYFPVNDKTIAKYSSTRFMENVNFYKSQDMRSPHLTKVHSTKLPIILIKWQTVGKYDGCHTNLMPKEYIEAATTRQYKQYQCQTRSSQGRGQRASDSLDGWS